MSLLVVGSVALDTVETPFGKAEEALGGSATYFSIAASYFTKVSVVGVVGNDFPDAHIELLMKKGIDTAGIEKANGKTFRWHGRYSFDMNKRDTLLTALNVFETFNPKIPAQYSSSELVFLGNIDPILQMNVLSQIKKPKLVGCDTMNFWIEGKPEELKQTLKRIDILIINDSESRELSHEANLVKAARVIRAMGPKILIVKRGEYGALMFANDSIFWAPALPIEEVTDPTGAGDSFAGGFMGYLSSSGNTSEHSLRQAIIYGSVMASFDVEDFGPSKMLSITRKDIDARYREFTRLTHFERI